MATFKSYTFGKISGKYGDALATKSKATGKNYLRVASEPTNPRTDKQVAHRAKFGFINSVLVPFYTVFKNNFGGNVGIRYAISLAFKNALVGEYPDFSIDMSKLVFSEGTLSLPGKIMLEKVDPGIFNIDWDTTKFDGIDLASLPSFVFYNEEKNQVYSLSGNVPLSAGTINLEMPEIWNGALIHVWIYFVSVDGLKKSGSEYIGTVVQ